MLNLRDLPIRKKLRGVIMLTCGAALLLACGAFAGYEWITFHNTMPRQQDTLAEIVGANCAAAVIFNDAKSAERTLGALQAEPHIVAACLYAPDGRPFAAYARSDAKKAWRPPVIPADGAEFQSDRLLVTR